MAPEDARTAAIASASAASSSANAAVAQIADKDTIVETTTTPSLMDDLNVGHPQEQLEVDEAGPQEDTTVYPTGPKVWLTVVTLCATMFLGGLDITVVAVAVPGLTDHFKTISDIGWYSGTYPLAYSATVFFFGKCYTVFRTKHVYLFGLATFELGSAICTFAPTSKAFIFGRVVAGIGISAIGGGMLKILKDMFPLSKQALLFAIVGGSQSAGLVSGPTIGGLLIGAFGWRACFGVNLPIGVLSLAFTAWAFTDPTPAPEAGLSFKEKVKSLNIASTLLVIPAIVCLLLALQWGGLKYGWRDPRIITLFVVFAITFSSFAYLQYRLGDKATVPLKIIGRRSILGGMLFSTCCNGILCITESYISIYYQGVRGYTPVKSGLLVLPMIIGLSVGGLSAMSAVAVIGHYAPFLFATSIIAPIASGLLTTVDLDVSLVKPAVLLGFIGVSVGLGIQIPQLVVQKILTSKEVPIGGAIMLFGGGLGNALWLCVSATLFQSRLGVEISRSAPSANVTALEHAGLSEIRHVIGSGPLRDVLMGYNEAVMQTLYLPLALCVLSIFGALSIERGSLKQKTS